MKYTGNMVMLSVFDGSPTPTKKLIAEQTKCSLKLSTGTIDVTSKQNLDFDDFLGGRQSGELTLEFFDDSEAVTGEVNGAVLEAIWAAKSRPKWVLESTVVGTLTREFFGLITSLDLNRDLDTGAMGTMTIKLTAKPTNTVVS